MQQFKSKYKDLNFKDTLSNIQSCLRLNDMCEIGDGSHLLYFNMIGLFSFRQLTIPETIDLWMEFLERIGIVPDYVTIHPDKEDWKTYYDKYQVEVRYDNDCIWSDGDIGGYCTEFYKDEIEIGNIVNTLEDSIDCGFGLERIEMIVNKTFKSKNDIIVETILKIIDSGVTPTYNKQGSILRKLLRICYIENIFIDHPFYEMELIRQEKIKSKYNRLKKKHHDKSKEWWWNTMGIDIDNLI